MNAIAGLVKATFIVVGGLVSLFFLFVMCSVATTPAITRSSSIPTVVRTPTVVPAPVLEVLPGLSWEMSSQSHVTARGEVKNIGGTPLKSVVAVVTFRTAEGVFVSTAQSLIDFDPLLPGQTSTFDVIERFNPAMQTFSLRFRSAGGQELLALNAP